jgi:hypothetical protein
VAESCRGTPPHTDAIPDAERTALIREAFRLEWFTVAWMTVEAIVAIASGIAAHSISLVAFADFAWKTSGSTDEGGGGC